MLIGFRSLRLLRSEQELIVIMIHLSIGSVNEPIKINKIFWYLRQLNLGTLCPVER